LETNSIQKAEIIKLTSQLDKLSERNQKLIEVNEANEKKIQDL